MGPPYGGLAAALLVGVRDHIPAPVYDSFRASGLAHLLAISGLHMGLFCLSVLMVIRAGFACLPVCASAGRHAGLRPSWRCCAASCIC